MNPPASRAELTTAANSRSAFGFFTATTPVLEAFPLLRKAREREVPGREVSTQRGDPGFTDVSALWQTGQHFHRERVCPAVSPARARPGTPAGAGGCR